MAKLNIGTWHAGQGNGEGSVFADAEGRMRCTSQGTGLWPICKVIDFEGEGIEHTHLIAAAPRMYRALLVLTLDERIAKWLGEHDPKALEQARQAIAQAEGGAA